MQEGKQMERLKLVSRQFRTESNVWHSGLPAAGPIRPSLQWCFSPAGVSCHRSSAGTQASWELAVHEGKQMEGLKLVSRQFRKQRLALWAASQLQEDAGKLGAGSAGRKANGRFEASF